MAWTVTTASIESLRWVLSVSTAVASRPDREASSRLDSVPVAPPTTRSPRRAPSRAPPGGSSVSRAVRSCQTIRPAGSIPRISVRTEVEEASAVTFRTLPGSPRQFRLSVMFVGVSFGQRRRNQDNPFHRRAPGMAAEGQPQAPLDRGGRSRHPGCPRVVWTVTTGANTWPFRCSALRGVGRAEQAQEAVVHGVGGFLGGHPAGLDLFFGGAAKGQAGGQQPAGGQGGVQVAAFLAAPDELQHPAE